METNQNSFKRHNSRSKRNMWRKYRKRVKWDDSYLKYLVLYLFFLLLVVFAITLLMVSNGVSKDSHEYIDELSQKSAIKISIALTLLSFVIILIAFIGCCATYTKSKLILVLFCLLLIFLVVIEFFSIYNSFYYNSKIKDHIIDDKFKDLTVKYYWSESDVEDNKTINSIVDSIQCKYNCCGTDSYKSWQRLRPQKVEWYPNSCCCHLDLQPSQHNCTEQLANTTNSCFSALNAKLKDIRKSVVLMAGIAIANSVIKLLGIFLVWHFGRQLRNNYIV